ncbi:nicotinate-nucleotide--dimethylbenzimidazole phosphoribosyltransferase [Halorientalis marina]|uniref:nicotinate-nucleotide--dimethylbenzimidazole phosphoribosyltransferase n=1 Tax=Halorientalis marina TaxID=2931976 RepID=UPI001FF32D65|nr:nicotinate-nucleotide--dimethylbenzimidazole phosphoribosyltransferase [Halorientalis marina]
MRLILVAGTTRTAAIDGISAAGADPDVMVHTPSADAEIVTYGEPIRAPVVPVSPSGCPTPAVVTRAVRELVGFDVTVVDGGLAEPTGAPTVTVGASAGGDIREQDPVPTAPGVFAAAREFGRAIPDDEVYVAETIPGGTTTALGVLRALGEDGAVSSSLPDNPLALKEEVVSEGLAASSLSPGGAAGEPKVAVRRMGDPVLATVAGFVVGCTETDTAVTLAGGTQLLAAAALVRHTGVETTLPAATTTFLAADESASVRDLAADLNVDLTVTDPGFDGVDHPALSRFVAGEAKEGVGMGGALALAAAAAVPMADVRERVLSVYDRLFDEDAPGEGATDADEGASRS